MSSPAATGPAMTPGAPAMAPAGEIIPLGAGPEAAVVDAATGSLAVFTPGAGPAAARLAAAGHRPGAGAAGPGGRTDADADADADAV